VATIAALCAECSIATATWPRLALISSAAEATLSARPDVSPAFADMLRAISARSPDELLTCRAFSAMRRMTSWSFADPMADPHDSWRGSASVQDQVARLQSTFRVGGEESVRRDRHLIVCTRKTTEEVPKDAWSDRAHPVGRRVEAAPRFNGAGASVSRRHHASGW
jgi:hypothetical protein